jgi:hypothetical protein
MIRRRVILFGIFIVVFLLSFFIGTFHKMSNDEAREFLKGYRASTQGIGPIGIFAHNLSNTIVMFIPGAGVGWGVYNAWSTGAAFKILMSLNASLSQSNPVLVLLSRPFGVMELVSYAIAMSQSLLLLFALVKKRLTKKEMIYTAIEIGIVSAILLAAAFVESSMIS